MSGDFWQLGNIKNKSELLLKMDWKKAGAEWRGEEKNWGITALITQTARSSLQKGIQVFEQNKPRCLPRTDKHLTVWLYWQLYLDTKAIREMHQLWSVCIKKTASQQIDSSVDQPVKATSPLNKGGEEWEI